METKVTAYMRSDGQWVELDPEVGGGGWPSRDLSYLGESRLGGELLVTASGLIVEGDLEVSVTCGAAAREVRLVQALVEGVVVGTAVPSGCGAWVIALPQPSFGRIQAVTV
ncbi:MAG: hypothetical protein ACRDQ2_03865 [Gaiellales bacterium]